MSVATHIPEPYSTDQAPFLRALVLLRGVLRL